MNVSVLFTLTVGSVCVHVHNWNIDNSKQSNERLWGHYAALWPEFEIRILTYTVCLGIW